MDRRHSTIYRPQSPFSFRPVHTLSHEDVQQERAQIDNKVRELKSSLRELKHRRNALAPISQLSTDVVLCIFEHLQNPFLDQSEALSAYPFRLHGSTRSENQMAWIRAMTHVCSSWRSLAIQTPSLWTQIRFKCRPLLLEMGRRCQSAPLSVVCDARDIRYGSVGSLLPEVLQATSNRIKHLEISLFTNNSDRVNLVSDGLKCLTTTILEAFNCKAVDSDRHVPGVHLPLGFLRHSSSNLRHLSLENCNFQNEGLTHPIDLPSLSELSISNAADHCAKLLGHITVAPTCRVSIVTHDQGEFWALINALRPFWERKWNDTKPLKSISIVPTHRPACSTKFCLGDDSTTDLDLDFVLVLCGVHTTGRRTTNIIRGLMSSLRNPSKQVSRLRVGIDMRPSVWIDLSETCLAIESFQVRNRNLSGFLYMLAQRGSSGEGVAATDEDENAGNSAEDPITIARFLTVESLTLGDFDLDATHGKEMLLKWIEYRQGLGMPLKRLNLLSSRGIPDGFIECLEQLVEVQLNPDS